MLINLAARYLNSNTQSQSRCFILISPKVKYFVSYCVEGSFLYFYKVICLSKFNSRHIAEGGLKNLSTFASTDMSDRLRGFSSAIFIHKNTSYSSAIPIGPKPSCILILILMLLYCKYKVYYPNHSHVYWCSCNIQFITLTIVMFADALVNYTVYCPDHSHVCWCSCNEYSLLP